MQNYGSKRNRFAVITARELNSNRLTLKMKLNDIY